MPLPPAVQGLLSVSITSNGQPCEDAAVISISVSRRVNRIPVARIVLADGGDPDKGFPLSNSDLFRPGAEIEIEAGYPREGEQAAEFRPGAEIEIESGYEPDRKRIFKGVVTKHGLRINSKNAGRLVIECRDPAVKMTIPRKNAVFVDQSDSQAIESLIHAYAGLDADVESTFVQHGEMVQYYCSDWHYMLARAAANGQLVIVEDGRITIGPPKTSARPALNVAYGADLMAFRADMDVRSQLSAVTAQAWDPAEQRNATATAGPPKLNEQGNLRPSDLAEVVGPEEYRLQTSAAMTTERLRAMAEGTQLKAGLARIRGRMKVQGNALVVPGALIELEGVGERFDGRVYVGGVDHRIANGEWTTDVRFGLDPAWFTGTPAVGAPAASDYLPGITGLHIGVVTRLDEDPNEQCRIQVRVPVLGDEGHSVWARLAQPLASNSFGAFYVPEVDDEVVLGFFGDDPAHPVVLGSLYSSNRPPPHEMTATNNVKGFLSRERLRLEFDEERKRILIETPSGNRVVLDQEESSIRIDDENGNKMTLDQSGIAIDSPKDIEIRAGGKIDIAATGSVSVRSDADVKVEGWKIDQSAQTAFTAQGGASAELSSAGQTTVKGAMVEIN